MEKKRTVPWEKVLVGVAILLFVMAVACFLIFQQRLLAAFIILIGAMFINFAMGTNRKQTIWQKLRWPTIIVIALIWTGCLSLGRHTYTGEITKVTRVEERHNGYHYEVTLKSGKQTYHLEDSVNMLVGKAHYLHLHASDKPVKVTTSGILPSTFLTTQNILSAK